jgi:hypothetical protein
MNEITKTTPSALALDGFAAGYSHPSDTDNGGSSMEFDGSKLKFTNDSLWVDRDENEVQAWLVALNVINRVQKWSGSGGAPVETITLKPGEPWPDVGEMNRTCPDEWFSKFGKLTGPWAGEHVVLFADLNSMAGYWWPSPTTNIGASRCIRDLMGQTRRKRSLLGGQLVFPIVELSHTFMPTAYGGRERPHLIVQKWVTFGDGKSALPDRSTMEVLEEPPAPTAAPTTAATTAPTATATTKAVERPSLKDELDDELPF